MPTYWENLGSGGKDWLLLGEKTFFNFLRLAMRDSRQSHFLISHENYGFHILPKGKNGEIRRTHINKYLVKT